MRVLAVAVGALLMSSIFVVITAIGVRDTGWRVVAEVWAVVLVMVAVVFAGSFLLSWGLS